MLAMTRSLNRWLCYVLTYVLSILLLVPSALSGNFALNWGTAPYTWTASSLGPNTYTLTDQYGFQVQVRMTVTQANGVPYLTTPDDLTTDGAGNTFGTARSIWFAWNPNASGGGINGSTNIGTLEILNGGTAFGVNGLSFRVSDIDSVDNNTNPPTNDRCDHLTFTGNAGNPTITAVTGAPTFLIGPGPGAGQSPALAANQVQCNFQVSTAVTSVSSNANDNGTAQLVFPNGTSTAVVNYDESVHNVYNNTSFNAATRGVGVWSAVAFTVNNTISLDKQTTSAGFSAAGNVIPYTYVVTNNGPLPLLSTQNITIQDDKIPTVTCPAIPAAGIGVGGTLTCSGSYTVTAADVTAGLVTNVATVGVGVGAQTFATRLQSNSDTVTVRRFATLTLVKTLTNDNGGTATTAAFTLSASGPTNISGVSGNAAVTNVSVQPGTYVLSENNVAGYTAGAWSCTAGTLTGSSLVLANGQNATCTINNNDIAPRLTLVKTVTNDNGGTATTSSVTLNASGPTAISGLSGTAAVTNVAVNAGTYTLSETALANYTPSAWSCTAGTLTGSSLVLSVGQTATCTINNNDDPPRLTLVKTVTNDNGGTATTAAFTLTATGPTNISGVSGAGTVTNAIVTAGTYVLSETNVAGYAPGAWSCTAGTLTGSSLVIGIGQSATCTINNNDIAPTLTLVKTITNDNGGTATLANFTLSATGPVTITGTSGAGSVTNATVSAGTYALAETTVAGYAASAWSCTAGTLVGANLTLALGQSATCTINNNDVAPRLTLVKTVTNDNGGTATTAAFTLSAAGPTNISGVSGAGTVTNAAVTAGTYVLSETNLAGYAPGAWNCTSGTLTGSSLVLSVGQTATCTINNNDIAPVLTLVKTVTDTSGGPSTIGAFILSATGPTSISGVTGAPSVTNANVSAGSYGLSEAGPAGYTPGAWSCTSGTLTGSSLVLSVGQTATCTINNIKLPTLTIRKISNGGTGAFGFSGSNGVTTQTITTTTAGGTFNGALMTLTAQDTVTTITETMPATFWQIQNASCTGMGTGGTANLVGNVLTLNAAATAAGRNIVCTFTNSRRPTVSVQKITTGAAGGAFSFADTNLTGTVANITTTATATATPATATRLIATTTGTAVTLTETSPLTFVTAGVTCNDANSAVSGNTNPVATSLNGAVTIPNTAVRVGADINCVFTNAQAAPQLTVLKTASVASVSTAGTVVNYSIAVTNSGNTVLNNIGVSDPLGTVNCPSSGAASVNTLAAGAAETCTLNYTVPQSVFDNNGGGDGDIDNTATASATYNATPVTANDSETVGLVLSPGLTVQKIPNTTAPVIAGNTIGYTYRVTNSGNVTMNNVTINDAHVGFGTPPVPGGETIFNDVAPTGNSTDAASNGSWDVLAPGDVIEFTSSYLVVQADIDNLQ
jgi:uncharacterized repeat protein (TIGR01451 family)